MNSGYWLTHIHLCYIDPFPMFVELVMGLRHRYSLSHVYSHPSSLTRTDTLAFEVNVTVLISEYTDLWFTVLIIWACWVNIVNRSASKRPRRRTGTHRPDLQQLRAVFFAHIKGVGHIIVHVKSRLTLPISLKTPVARIVCSHSVSWSFTCAVWFTVICGT